MIYPVLEAGCSYRLRRNFEVRDEQSGTMKHFFLGDTVLKVRKAEPESGRVWVEGCPLPLPYDALRRVVDVA